MFSRIEGQENQHVAMIFEPQASDGNGAMPMIYSCFHGNKSELHVFISR